jgi:hypothetical protein
LVGRAKAMGTRLETIAYLTIERVMMNLVERPVIALKVEWKG